MKKRFILGLVCLGAFTSPVWFFVLKNDAAAFRLNAQLGNATLPDGARVVSSFSLVANLGNSDGCDYEAIAIIRYYGKVAALQSSYIDLMGTMSDEEPRFGQNDNPAIWGAKLSNLLTEFQISPNVDHAGLYLVSVKNYARNVSLDLRCW